MFSTVHHRDILCVQGNTLTITLEFFINYCKLINIFSTQLWFYLSHTHTQTHTNTYIIEGSILITELLSLKSGVWLS